MKITESTIQGVLMVWLLNEKHHDYVIPNSNQFFGTFWESDLISITRAGLCHEYEIKISEADYKRDAAKRKHLWLGQHGTPAYFWYVTYDFWIDPPQKAGWIYIHRSTNGTWLIDKKKEAPRLNNWHISEDHVKQIARILSWRLAHSYHKQFVKGGES